MPVLYKYNLLLVRGIEVHIVPNITLEHKMGPNIIPQRDASNYFRISVWNS